MSEQQRPPSSEDGAVTVTPAALREWPMPRAGQKDARGRVLVVAGSDRTPGAAVLAAEAALRSGAGKVQVVTVASVAAAMSVAVPEALVAGVPARDGRLPASAADVVLELAEGCSTVLLGPGLLDCLDLMEAVVPQLSGTVVLDALGLSYVTAHRDGLAHLGGDAVLTPNATELAICLDRDEDEVSADTAGAVRELAATAGCAVVSGGATTWTASPDGRLWRDGAGGGGLGTAGSGDV
ncbi:NAD(P)H-hydrate dehydratase, partial [Angustibacter aerolatus]